MDSLRPVLARAAAAIADYRERLPDARVGPAAYRDDVRRALGAKLPEAPASLDEVIDELLAGAAPGLVASAGPRYFGLVVGGSLDAALAFEGVAGRWLKELLHLPAAASVGFVTGGRAANTVGLAAARRHVLHDHGWDVGREGLRGAPRVRVVAGAERHATIDRSLRLLGLGEAATGEVPATPNGAIDPDALRFVVDEGAGAPLTGQVAGRELGGSDFVPESSRRARGFATWAALRSLGRSGVAELIDRCCALARRFATGLGAHDGIEIANDIVLNQVLVRVGDAGATERVERRLQEEGTLWLGATTWRCERLLRISVPNWSTTEADVDHCIEAIARTRGELA